MIYRFDPTTCPSTLESMLVTMLRSHQTMDDGNAGDYRDDGDSDDGDLEGLRHLARRLHQFDEI